LKTFSQTKPICLYFLKAFFSFKKKTQNFDKSETLCDSDQNSKSTFSETKFIILNKARDHDPLKWVWPTANFFLLNFLSNKIFIYKNALAFCQHGDSVFSPTGRCRGPYNAAKNKNGKYRKSLQLNRRPKRLQVHGHGSHEVEINEIPTD
jgi:hypothetical protein